MKIENFDKQRVTLVKYKINRIRESITDNQLRGQNDQDWERGVRFNDTDTILANIFSCLNRENGMNIYQANVKFLSLNSTEIESYIKQSLFSAAYTDYYYKYEKQYD